MRSPAALTKKGRSPLLAGDDFLREPEYRFLVVSQDYYLIVISLELEISSPQTNGHMRISGTP